MKQVILFDFFGTLVEYTPGSYFKKQRRETYEFLLQQGYNFSYEEWETLSTEAYKELSDEGKRTQDEFHMHTLMKKILGDQLLVGEQESFIDRLTNLYLAEWNKDIFALPKIHDLLDHLSKNYTLGIISNTYYPTLVADNLQRVGITKYFAHITTSITHGKRKPHPSIFKDTLTSMKAKAEDTIFVGDNYEEDYLGAKQMNMKAYLIDTKKLYLHLGEDRLDTLFDLYKLV